MKFIFKMASESFKVGRGAGETAEPVRYLLFKHEFLALNPRTQ